MPILRRDTTTLSTSNSGVSVLCGCSRPPWPSARRNIPLQIDLLNGDHSRVVATGISTGSATFDERQILENPDVAPDDPGRRERHAWNVYIMTDR